MTQLYLRTITIIFLMTGSLMSNGQNRVIKTQVHFGINKSELDTGALRSLKAMFDTLGKMEISKIVLKGNSDNAGDDSLYNLLLSQKRADSVRSFLISMGVPAKSISISFFGEEKPIADNNTEEGRQRNRRVEVLVSYKPKPIKVEEKDIEMVVKARKDTTVKLPNGWQMYGSGVFYDLSCLTVNVTPANDSSTVPPDSLAAMINLARFKIEILAKCKSDTVNCFKQPITIRIPMPMDLDKAKALLRAAQLYEVSANGGWYPTQSRLKVVRIQDKVFLEVPVYCLNTWINCMTIRPCDAKVRLIAPSRYSFSSILTSYGNFQNLRSPYSKEDKPNRQDACLLCADSSGTVRTKLKDADGHEIMLNIPLMKMMKMKTLLRMCGKDNKPRRSAIPPVIRKRYHISNRMINRADRN